MGIRGITYKGSVIILLLAAMLICDNAQGQSRRERRRMEQRRKEIERRRAQPDKRPADKVEDRRNDEPIKAKPKKKPEVAYPRSTIKDVYRIDVLVALYLDELVKIDKPAFKKIPEKAVNGIDFYQGIKLATDTLDAKGYRFEVFVHGYNQPQ